MRSIAVQISLTNGVLLINDWLIDKLAVADSIWAAQQQITRQLFVNSLLLLKRLKLDQCTLLGISNNRVEKKNDGIFIMPSKSSWKKSSWLISNFLSKL